MPLLPCKILFLKSIIKFSRQKLIAIIPATVPMKNAIYAAKTISSSIICIVVNFVEKGEIMF